MSIADRINSMASNLSSAYGKIAYLGVDLSEVDKNLQNLSTVLDTVYNDYPKVSDEGVSPSITGSKVGRLNSTLKASDTTQFSTTGKNLSSYSNDLASYINTENKMTKTGSGKECTLTKTVSGTTSPRIPFSNSFFETSTTYYVSFKAKGDWNSLSVGTWFNNTQVELETITPSTSYQLVKFSFTYPSTKYNDDRIFFRNNDTNVSVGQSLTITDFMISKEDVDFEPYTNGASPNPDYPQNINVIKGNNNITVCGKNLWGGFAPFTAKPVGGTFTTNTDGSITATASNLTKSIYSCDGTQVNNHNLYQELEPGTYTVSVQGTKPDYVEYQLYELPSNDTTLIMKGALIEGIREFTLTKKAKIGLRLRVNVGAELDNYTFKIMIERGSEATAYEPYTSVTLPIGLPVQNLLPTDENAWEQGTINTATGENQDSTIRIRTINYYPIKNDIDYYISVQDTDYCFLNILLYDISQNYINQYYAISSSISGATSLKINIKSSIIPNVAYMKVTLRKSGNASSTKISPNEVSIIKPMIELGDKPSRYTPYGVAPIELCKINAYQDKSFKAVSGDTIYDSLTAEQKEGLVSGGWYKYGMIRKVVFNGSEGWAYDNHLDTPEARTIIRLANSGYQTSQYIASHFIQGSTTANKIVSSSVTMYLSLADSITGVLENDTEQEKLNKMKAWLNTHNVDFYYVLATPTITQIIDATLISQLEALYNAMSYNGQTNILQTNADLPFIISASALKGE